MNIRSVPENVIRFNPPTSMDSSSHTRSEIAHKVIAWKKKIKGQMKYVEPQDMVNMWENMAKWRYTKINLKTRIKIAYAA